MSEAPRESGNRSGRIRWAAATLPGLPSILQGGWRLGLALLILAGSLVALLLLAGDRVAATFNEGGAGNWIAFLTVILGLIVAWGLGIVDMVWQRGATRSGSQWSMAWREFKKNQTAVLGLYVLVVLCLATLLAPYLTRYDPNAMIDLVATRHLSPSADHVMGTDEFGRDVLTRVLYGARISLSIAFIAVVISVTLGTAVGAASGFFGGAVDTVLMRFVDMLISFPRLVLLITVIALFERSIALVILVLGLTLWPSTARIVRGEVLSLREREFIQAARALGLSSARIIYRHIVPNVLGPVIVAATLGIGNIILIEAGLSFLSLSIPPPDPSWGTMIYDGREFMLQAWWVATFPGLAIVVTVVAFNLVGDGLRDALDPRLRV